MIGLNKNINVLYESTFQKEVWEALYKNLEQYNTEYLDEKSSVDGGSIINVILYYKFKDFILCFSISNVELRINTKYFDIYVGDEISLEKIKLLITELLYGRFKIEIGYRKSGKVNSKKIVFDNDSLNEFNEGTRSLFFKKSTNIKVLIGSDLLFVKDNI